MKRSTQILALFLSVLMLFSLLSLTSCNTGGESGGETTENGGESTTDNETTKEPDLTTDGDASPDPEATTADDVTTEADVTTNGDGTTEADVTTNSDGTTEADVTTSGDGTTEADITTGGASTEPTPELGNGIGDLCYSRELSLIFGSGTVNIEDLRGKVIILNFWGAWCPPCREELVNEFPAIPEAYGNDVVILTIHSVYRYDADSVDSLLTESGLKNNSSFLFAIDSGNEAYYTQLGGPGYWPYTLVIDKNGVIIQQFVGAVTYAEDLKPLLDAAVGN